MFENIFHRKSLKDLAGSSLLFPLNKYVRRLGGTPIFTEDLRGRFKLLISPAYSGFISMRERQMAEINTDFHNTEITTNEAWKGPDRTNSHTVTRFAVHRFRHIYETVYFYLLGAIVYLHKILCVTPQLPCGVTHHCTLAEQLIGQSDLRN